MDSPRLFVVVVLLSLSSLTKVKIIFHNTLKIGQCDKMDAFHCHNHPSMYTYYTYTDDTSLVRTGFWLQPRVIELERFTVCTCRNLNPCTSCRPANQ